MKQPIDPCLSFAGAWRVVARTQCGRKHRAAGVPNEDAVHALADPAGGLAIAVADGVGGGCHGEIASAAVAAHWVGSLPSVDASDAVHDAHAALAASEQALSKALPAAHGRSGSMLVGAWAWPDGTVWLGHVGDCRAYLWRGSRVRAVTRDHTYANLGLVPPAWRCLEHPARMVGGGMMGPPDLQRLNCAVGDALLLCSDGMHAALGDDQLQACLAGLSAEDRWLRADPSVKARAGLLALARLCRLSRASGGDDDITVALVWYAGAARMESVRWEPAQAAAESWCDSAWPTDVRPPGDGLPVFKQPEEST